MCIPWAHALDCSSAVPDTKKYNWKVMTSAYKSSHLNHGNSYRPQNWKQCSISSKEATSFTRCCVPLYSSRDENDEWIRPVFGSTTLEKACWDVYTNQHRQDRKIRKWQKQSNQRDICAQRVHLDQRLRLKLVWRPNYPSGAKDQDEKEQPVEPLIRSAQKEWQQCRQRQEDAVTGTEHPVCARNRGKE